MNVSIFGAFGWRTHIHNPKIVFWPFYPINRVLGFHQILHSNRSHEQDVITCDIFFSNCLRDIDFVEGQGYSH